MVRLMRRPVASALLLSALAVAAPASAATIFSENFNSTAFRGTLDGPSTSDRFGDTLYYNTVNANGWTFDGYTHIAVNAANTLDGALHLNEAANGRSDGVAFAVPTLEANTTYSLSFLLSGDNRPGEAYNFIASIAGSTFNTAGIVGASGANPGTTYTYLFTTGAATSYTLNLSQSVPAGSGGSPIVDNIVIASVPEPATWAMMLVGFGLVAGMVRRRRSATVTYA